jgi:hypothetical protein
MLQRERILPILDCGSLFLTDADLQVFVYGN